MPSSTSHIHHHIGIANWGPLYIPVFGLPSLSNLAYDKIFNKHTHKYFYTETDANRRAYKYFSRKILGYTITKDDLSHDGWYINKHPFSRSSNQPYVQQEETEQSDNSNDLINVLNIKSI